MYKQTTVYGCPICETDYLTLGEAEECLEYCKDDIGITSRSAWACQTCREIFYTSEQYAKHSLSCSQESCTTCEHCDLEGRRSGPCRQYNNAPITSACEDYERAYK